ncbi:MAG: glycosyltransferase family 4 protein [Alphaproteobacteria bacterium]
MNGSETFAAAGEEIFLDRRLKVLLISYWFPPTNVIGAIRVGHFAKSLYEAGHDIRVLAAQGSGDQSLSLTLPAERVTYVRAPQGGTLLNPFVRPFLKLVRRFARTAPAPAPAQAVPAGPPLSDAARSWRNHYYALMRFPDAYGPWRRRVTAAGYRLVKAWRPDIILASAPPNSALIAAQRIARACGAPWIADLRDLWSDNFYHDYPTWRYWIDRPVERYVLRSAVGLITVTPIWADMLRHRYEQPVGCILNGFVSEDFPSVASGPEPGDVVSILYTGGIYLGYRDPTPLFQAIGLLTPAERRHVAVHFYGPGDLAAEGVRAAASAAGVHDRVFLHGRVSYQESLSLQQSADILLLLQWNHVKDAGNIPAKFFEYLGARRPILLLGYEHGNLAQMIRERGAGVVANDPPLIAEQLRRWIGQRPAGIPPIPETAREGMSRDDQYRKLERFLARFVR